MVRTGLDPRLAALLPIVGELKALRAYLKQLSDRYSPQDAARWDKPDDAPVGMHGSRPPFWHPIKWIDDSLERVTPHLHGRRWPPVWWRLSGMTIDAVFRNIYRADGDGYFFAPDPEHPGFGKGYIPERDEILARVDRINEMYKAARHAR